MQKMRFSRFSNLQRDAGSENKFAADRIPVVAVEARSFKEDLLMAAVVSITSINSVGQQIRVAFNLILTGNYPTGGDTVNFATAVQDPAFVGMAAAVEALGAPISLDIWDQGGNLTDT